MFLKEYVMEEEIDKNAVKNSKFNFTNHLPQSINALVYSFKQKRMLISFINKAVPKS
jgi:hypothetical protein